MELKRLKLLKNNKGAALMYTMMFLLLLSVIVVSFSLISINMYKTTAYSANKTQNFALAKAIGQAFALELSEDVDATSIVAYLENNTQYAKTVKGSASVVFDPQDDSKKSQINQALKGTGLTIDDLAEINLIAGLKFYFKITCANCGAVLEDIKDSSNRDSTFCQSSVCRGLHNEKNINKKYLYLDVTVSYHGVTEVVTTVFTYLDKEDFTQTMYDLFSVYNIYSTSPKDMQFDFAAPDDIGGVQPNVYLYNGVDSEDEGYGTTTRETYKLEESIKANLTSTGDVTITSSSGEIRSILGTVTSYGAMTLERVNIGNGSSSSNIFIRNSLTVNSTARVHGSIYARNTVKITGPNSAITMVDGTIYALGNVTIQNCTVGRIIGGAGCNITLINANCNSISTDGSVTIDESTVTGNVYCGDLTMKSSGRESKITGKAEVKGNLVIESTSSGKNTIGSTSNQNVINVSGNATFKGNGTKVSEILGNVIIAGSINYNNSKSVTKINGSLHVKGDIPVTIGEERINACYLSALEVTGDVLLSSGKGCVPLFGKENGSTSEAKTVIGGLLTLYTDMLIGDELGGIIDGEENSTGVSYTFVDGTPKYVNLNGATINKLYIKKKGSTSDITQALLQNGTIVSGIEAEQIIVSGITIEENCVVMAAGINGAFVAVDNSKLKGKIVANRMFSLHEGSILYATQNGFVHVSGTETEKALAYIDGEIAGELVVGQKITVSQANGELKIKSKAVLHGNSLDKDIYINGDLTVEAHSMADITNNPEQFAPRLTTENNNGSRIYLSTGTAYLNGWVYDFYVNNAEVIMQDEIEGMAGKPYIKGTTYDSSDFVTIGENGLINSEGATYTNDNVIVYVYKTPMEPLGDLTISGTLVLKKGERLECNSLKVERIITDDINEELTPSNFDSAKTRIINRVKNFNFNSDSRVTGITVNGDTQINQTVSDKILITDCTFNGWLKLKNVSGTVTITRSEVTGAKYTSYAGNDTKANNAYKGCLDVGSANLHLENSFVGGTASKNNVTQDSSIPYQGNVYTNGVFTMNGGQVYGTVYCSYATDLIDNKISGGLVMSTTSSVSVNWSPTFINKFIYGPKVKATVTSGTLCGTSPSSTATANNLDTNSYFIRLQDLTMSDSAVIAEYVSVFVDDGADTKLAGKNIGNVYAKTAKLTIYVADSLSTTKVAGYMYCVGQLQYADGLTPTAAKGLYAKNTTIPISENNIPFENINGNVDITGSLTFDVSFNNVTGYVYAPKANVTLNSTVEGNIEANTLYVTPKSQTEIKGNVLVNSLYVYTDSYKVHFLENVKTSLLAVNLKLKSTGGDITLTTKIDNPDGQFAPTVSGGSYVSFYENVYVSTGTSGSGRAFLRCCTFEKRNVKNSNNGATLYADRGVYASTVNFYGAGYVSTQQHCFTSGLGVYNIPSSNYSTNYGSIVAGIAKSETTSYGLYLSDTNCYSNIVLLSSQSAYLNKTTLGERANADSMSADRKKSYQKYYSFGGDVTMNETHIESITSTNSADPGAYTYVNVVGNLTLKSNSYIGSSYSTERVHAHTGFKGVYVAKRLTIDSGCTVRLNIYCKGALNNNGSIQLNIEKKIEWRDTKGWGWTDNWEYMESIYTCGGVVYSNGYSGSGYFSLNTYTKGYQMDKDGKWQKFYQKENEGHNTIAGVIDKPERKKDYSFCTHNSANRNTNTSSAEGCPFSPNKITSTTLAGNQVTCGVSRDNSTPTAPTKDILQGFVGVEWNTTEATEGKYKTPLNIIAFSHATTIKIEEVTLVSKTSLPSTQLDTSNRTYWKPQAIPLRWYLPTQTTAGEPVSLNPNANNMMTVAQKKLGESIDALEACQQNFKEFKELNVWEWIKGDAIKIAKELKNNAKSFFKNLPTLFTPSSSYLGLKFKNDADAKFYRVTATKASSVMSDANGKDLLVITRRCMVVNGTFPSGKLLNDLIEHVNWNPDWVIPINVKFNQRPVGLVFFNSGVVPYSVFDGKNTEYRKYTKESSEKDDAGRWYWGDDGSEGWYGTASPSNDVTWTFFTCEDPTKPYTSKAKDLHIILPKNAKMVWEKDKDSCVNIIGNGRVFLYLQEGTDIKIIGNGFSNWIHDEYMSGIDSWLDQWRGEDATYNVFGGVRYVQTEGYGIDETTYYKNGQVVMDEAAYNSGHFQLQPRMYIIGTGGNINFEVEDFQTAAYVYMPSGYTYENGAGKNTFKISSNHNAEGSGNWDVYGIYVCDDFEYGNGTGAKVRYFKTAPDLSNTVFKYTKNGYTTTSIGDNRSSYQLAEFWDYPTDLPVSSMDWYYRGIAIS